VLDDVTGRAYESQRLSDDQLNGMFASWPCPIQMALLSMRVTRFPSTS